jgi:hypothetical protein
MHRIFSNAVKKKHLYESKLVQYERQASETSIHLLEMLFSASGLPRKFRRIPTLYTDPPPPPTINHTAPGMDNNLFDLQP